jgi:hypothetical protein
VFRVVMRSFSKDFFRANNWSFIREFWELWDCFGMSGVFNLDRLFRIFSIGCFDSFLFLFSFTDLTFSDRPLVLNKVSIKAGFFVLFYNKSSGFLRGCWFMCKISLRSFKAFLVFFLEVLKYFEFMTLWIFSFGLWEFGWRIITYLIMIFFDLISTFFIKLSCLVLITFILIIENIRFFFKLNFFRTFLKRCIIFFLIFSS